MLHSLLNVLPLGGNMKVFFGVSLLLGMSYMPLYLKKSDAVAAGTMADKGVLLRRQQRARKRRKVPRIERHGACKRRVCKRCDRKNVSGDKLVHLQ